ncbi:MAG: hypothetical protein MRZ79_20440 [Bacteroidia bacterium]|nr:hypothetical protein [Bacteroidia bacterium]
MKYSIIVLFISVLMIKCTPKTDDQVGNADVKLNEVLPHDSASKKPMSLEDLENENTSLTIIEYDQWNKLIETVITNEGIFRFLKNWQNGRTVKELYSIEIPNFFSQLDGILKTDFQRNHEFHEEALGNSYIVRLKIKRGNNSAIDVSYINCKSKELENLISIINRQLPHEEKIQLKGNHVIDTFVPADSITNWLTLKATANYNDISSFNLRSIDKNSLVRIDSTIFGQIIYETHSLTSAYIVSVRESIGVYIPCVILVEQYESDQLMDFLALFLIDSTFSKIGDYTFISTNGSDYEEDWNYYATIKDSLLIIHSNSSFECLGEDEEIKSLKTKEFYHLTERGQIEEVKSDTTEIVYCR